MKAKWVSCLFAAAVIAGITTYRPAVDPRSETAEIDFADLHSQASSALQALRTSQEFRIAAQDNN